MSWFVERLLTDSERIHLKGFHSEMLEYLLTLEMKIKELYEKGYISDEEISFIDDLRHNKTITQIAKEKDISRVTASTKIDKLTNKISMFLGGVYTDEGYLNFMKEKYGLNDGQINVIRKKITSDYKRFYLR